MNDKRGLNGVDMSLVPLPVMPLFLFYTCKYLASGELYACKSISNKKLRTRVDIDDVRREVEIMKHLPKHSNIVTLKDTYEDDIAVHLVMELCEGGELFDRIFMRGHYTERAAAAVTRTIVEVIQMFHKHGVMHRDLKPEKFLFSNKKETAPLKAIDFGLSVFFKPETEQGVAQAIIRSVVDFRRDPWPKVSDNAKDLVKKMLNRDPSKRLTAQQFNKFNPVSFAGINFHHAPLLGIWSSIIIDFYLKMNFELILPEQQRCFVSLSKHASTFDR
ncbi:hypothetical protein RND71_036803 [Anisodus tanguticus]|uniref:Protein kinase domain-containing protein n=1 Tax=Anisodus tanguticus TaxID=243964 RepID=A0AAE1R161_9SOLA|nr:hypothetical protein RND71_036803 [Anisodus tanguticus]